MHFDAPTFFLACGVLYLAMPIMVWVLLHRQHRALNVNLWCLSGILFAASIGLYGLRDQVSDFVGVVVTNALGYVAGALLVCVLRMEGGRRPMPVLLTLFCAAGSLLTHLANAQGELVRQGTVNAIQATMSLLLAATAVNLARTRNSRSAALMALLFGLTGLALAVRAVSYLGGSSTSPAFTPDPLFLTVMLLSLFNSVASTVGFMGLALDRARRTASSHWDALQTLSAQQSALELATRTRAAVAGERARTTRLLAHEVRQPLHNAAVALQSAIHTLSHSRDAAEAAHAIEQAQAVIRRVSATLDNTVAATELLSGADRIRTVDADLQVLIDLCLGDLSPQARPRVRVDYLADARSVRLEPTLVRLALRNLLTNATQYSPPGSPVTLRVLDSDEPLALVLEVADLGPGIPEVLRESIFEEGVRGDQPTVPGHGLGLHVVKRVARLHGGTITCRPNQPVGSIFTLTLPQGDPG
jgi:signal transduction histidine kinase